MPSSKGLAVQENAPRRPGVAGMLARDHVAVLMSTIGTPLSRGCHGLLPRHLEHQHRGMAPADDAQQYQISSM